MGSLRDSHLCRICAEESLMPSVLFGGDSKELRDKIMFFLPLSILESSDMPRVICQKCNQDLDSLVEFFQTLNQGQIKLLDLLSERKRKRPSWNGKKQSLFDKKYPSGVERKPTHHKKDDEDFSSAYEDPTMLMEHSNGKQEVSFGDTSMRFECLEPSCHLRFQNAQQIEQHLKVENHSTMTLVVPSEVVANQNSLEDPLAVSSSHSNLPELKDLSMPPATASAKTPPRRRATWTLAEKSEAVRRVEGGESRAKVAQDYGTFRQVVSKWCRNSRLLLSGKKTAKRVRGAGRKPASAELESLLLEWLHHGQGSRATGYVKVREKAKEIAATLGLQNFAASACWMKKFSDRNKLSLSGKRPAPIIGEVFEQKIAPNDIIVPDASSEDDEVEGP